MYDEILIQEAREQLASLGMGESSIEAALEQMRDAGSFTITQDLW